MKRMFAITLLAAALTALTAGCGPADLGSGSSVPDSSGVIEFEAQTWTLLCPANEESSWTQAAEYFSNLISRETNGAVTVECDSSDQMTPAEGIQALENGKVTLALYDNLSYAQMDPRFYVVSMPFLYTQEEDADAILDGAGGTALRAILEEYHLHGIGFGEAGFRCPTNNVREVKAPADLKGLRICVSDSAMLKKTYELWGAEPVSTEKSMVYTALQTGTYDGQELPLTAADASAIQEVQKYATDWNGVYDSLFFCMNKDFYDALPSDLRSIVDDCGQQTITYQRKSNQQAEQGLLARWQQSGVKVTELTKDAAQSFRKLSETCYQEFSSQLTEELLAVFTGR